MDPMYPRFARAHPLFYDEPRRGRDLTLGRAYVPAQDRSWIDWSHNAFGPWSAWSHPDGELPEQGWKVHVTALPANASDVLHQASEYCHREKLSFKFLRSEDELDQALSKDADRGSAGKFITIYPPTQSALQRCLDVLDERLSGHRGPYILSDLRWRNGPLFVRYGAFIAQSFIADGVEVAAMTDLRDQRLVPDERPAFFAVPPWAVVPEFIQAQIDALSADPPPGFPLVTGVLHHSNAGGVYTATHEGESVVLKEARPLAGWTPDGRDAVARLCHEEDTLRRIAPSVRAPRVRGALEAHGHRFLALERMPGRPLSEVVASTSPLALAAADRGAFVAYRDWALPMLERLRRELSALHATGVAHGDLHPGNVLVDDNGSIALIDFEMSVPADSHPDAVIGAPGFVGTGHANAAARDDYARACIELHVFLPITPLIGLDAGKIVELVDEATRIFEIPATWGERVANDLGGVTTPGLRRARPYAWTVEAIAQRLHDDASPERLDRLWPGDPRQFGEPRFSLGHGALGVAVALHAAGIPVSDDIAAWITHALRDPSSMDRLGLMDGIAGAIWGCRRLGWHAEADSLLDQLTSADFRRLGTDLASGLPGVGLALLDESDGDHALVDRSVRVLEDLTRRLQAAEAPSKVPSGRGGLMGGATGTALLALRLYERTEDAAFLVTARHAIEFDLCSLSTAEDGALHVNEGWRTLPYLANGSAGIGTVLAQYLAWAPDDDRFRTALNGLTLAASSPFVSQAGLLRGRAGLIQFLVALGDLGLGTAQTASAIRHHLSHLSLHGLPRSRFAGDGLLRASCDLATGAAGVLSALLAVRRADAGLRPWCGIPHVISPHGPRPVADRS